MRKRKAVNMTLLAAFIFVIHKLFILVLAMLQDLPPQENIKIFTLQILSEDSDFMTWLRQR